jgi:sulfate adenylyltransferase
MAIQSGELLISPYGGRLVNLLASEDDCEELRARARKLAQVQLTPRALCDLELLATGSLSPLGSFMARRDYERVLGEKRLSEGTAFPIPITLNFARDARVRLDQEIALTDDHNDLCTSPGNLVNRAVRPEAVE